MMLFAILVALPLLVTSLNPFIPISTSQAPIVFNGIETTMYTATISCSSDIPFGTLTVGDGVTIDIECIPPRYHYNYEHKKNVPADMILHIHEVCLSGDPERLNITLTAQRLLATTTHPGVRRLLGVIIGEIFPWYGNALLSSRLTDLQNDYYATKTKLFEFKDQVVLFMSGMNNWTASADREFAIQRATSRLFQEEIQNTQDDVTNLYQNQADILNFLNVTGRRTADEFARVGQTFSNLQGQIATEVTNVVEYARQKALQVLDIVSLNANLTQLEFANSDAQVRRLADNQDHIASVLWNTMKMVQVRRELSSLFFIDALNLPDDEIALVKDGIYPASMAPPEKQRLLIQSIKINYVASRTVESSTFAQLMQYRVDFYAGTLWAIQQNKPGLDIEWLMRFMETANCTRPYTGVDGLGQPIPEQTGMDPLTLCPLWAELTLSTCRAADNHFRWNNTDGSGDPMRQEGTLHTTDCAGGVITVNPIVVFRSFLAWQRYFGSTICSDTFYIASTKYQIIARLPGYIRYDSQNTATCSLSFKSQSQSRPLDVFYIVMSLVELFLKVFIANVFIAETELYGRLPHGLQYEQVPFTSTPTEYDSDGVPIIDGAAQIVSCTYAYWMSAKTAIVPLYEFTQKTSNYLTKQISVSAIHTSDGSIAPEYTTTVTGTDVTLDNPFPLPPSLIIPGDIDGPYVYDVPSRSIDISINPKARDGTVSFYQFDPTDVTIPAIDEWERDNNYQFMPLMASVGIDAYKHGKGMAPGFDGNLYPYCLTPGGIPANVSLNDTALTNPLAPNGEWCTVLKNYFVYKVVRAGKFQLELVPRTWIYRPVQISIPSGRVATILGGNVCPESTLRATGPTSLLLVIKNIGSSSAQFKYTITPLDTARVECQISVEIVISITGEKYVEIPDCGLVTVAVSRLISVSTIFTYRVCDTFNVTTVQDIFNDIGPTIPPNIRRSQVLVVDEGVRAFPDIFAGITNVLSSSANTAGTREDILNAIAHVRASVQNDTFVATFWNNATFTASPAFVDGLVDLLGVIKNQSTASQEGQLRLRNEVSALLNASDAEALLRPVFFAIMKNATQAIRDLVFPDGIRPVTNDGNLDLSGIANFGNGLAGTVSDIFRSPFTFGSMLGNTLGNIVGFIMYAVLIGGIVFIVFKIYQACKSRPSSHSSVSVDQVQERIPLKSISTRETEL